MENLVVELPLLHLSAIDQFVPEGPELEGADHVADLIQWRVAASE